MSRVRVLVPGLDEPLTAALPPGASLLVGRNPDPAALPAAARAGDGSLSLLPVPSRRVSEQHCLLRNDGARVSVTDLGSTNGTRWLLAARQTVTAPAGDVSLELAPEVGPVDSTPAPIEWVDAADFRRRLRDAVGQWIDDRALRAEAVLVREEPPSARALPLGDGWSLRLVAPDTEATRDLRFERALQTLWSYVREQRGAFEADRDSAEAHGDLVLASPVMRTLHRRICQAARKGLHGVLQGESGVGKSALARCFHTHSERGAGPFVETNLGEDSDDRKYFQMKLFGARAGASSTLTRDQVGLVQAADGGTLFLDEVALLPLEVQGVLLRFLDRGCFRRLGDPGDVPERRASVRVVVGTNTDLRAAVRAGAFREDLWWRLSGIVLDIPPLRERREDIEAVLRRERLPQSAGERSVYDALTPEARRFLLQTHPWRGNFREVANFLARLDLFADSRASIDLDVCVAALASGSLSPVGPTAAPAVVRDETGWADLLPLAHRLLPHWLRARAAPKPDEARHAGFEFRVFQEEVLKPLCMARALGVEHWDEAPRRPDPSYRAMADSLGYADGKTVQSALQCFVELKRLRAALESR